MVGPFLLQAALGEGGARSQLWVRLGRSFPSPGTRVRPAQQHRAPPHSGLGTCFQGRHLGGNSPHRSEDSVHVSPEGSGPKQKGLSGAGRAISHLEIHWPRPPKAPSWPAPRALLPPPCPPHTTQRLLARCLCGCSFKIPWRPPNFKYPVSV